MHLKAYQTLMLLSKILKGSILMNEFVIITDSSSDLPVAVAEELGVKVIPLEVNMEGDIRLNDQIDIKEFYSYLRAKHGAKTSAINIDRFTDTFEPFYLKARMCSISPSHPVFLQPIWLQRMRLRIFPKSIPMLR